MSSPSYCRRTLREQLAKGDMPKWLIRHPRRPYIVRAVLATPPWVKASDFIWLVKDRDNRTRRTQVRHVLDHIVPLTHPFVCGLNVPWNVRVVTDRENALKSNFWYDDTPEHRDLFSSPEQFRLFA